MTGKAQDAYSALSSVDSKVYVSFRAAVLKAYELVPEAYHQRFRSWERSSRQTHMEFSWVHTYEALCDLIILEQFKNSVPSHIATYISEQKVKTAIEAATLADECVDVSL